MTVLEKVTQLRRMLQDLWCRTAEGQMLVSPLYETLLERTLPLLPPRTSYRVLQLSTADLVGHVLTPERARQVGWRLAAGVKRLRAGECVLPWRSQRVAEHVLLRVLEVIPGRRGYRDQPPVAGIFVQLEVQTGSPASLRIRRFWSLKYLRVLSRRCGFDRYRVRPVNWPKGKPFLPFQHPLQYYGMLFRAYLTPESCSEKLDYAELDCPTACREHNRLQLQRQSRLGHQCPLNWDLACYRCPAGRTQCRAAVRPLACVQHLCAQCGKPRWVDAARRRCYGCQAQQLYRGDEHP